jgi:hypothetical protein
MDDLDRDYYEWRAEAELSLAQSALHPAAVRSHYIMAGHYLDRIYGQDNEAAVPVEESQWAGRGRC